MSHGNYLPRPEHFEFWADGNKFVGAIRQTNRADTAPKGRRMDHFVVRVGDVDGNGHTREAASIDIARKLTGNPSPNLHAPTLADQASECRAAFDAGLTRREISELTGLSEPMVKVLLRRFHQIEGDF